MIFISAPLLRDRWILSEFCGVCLRYDAAICALGTKTSAYCQSPHLFTYAAQRTSLRRAHQTYKGKLTTLLEAEIKSSSRER